MPILIVLYLSLREKLMKNLYNIGDCGSGVRTSDLI